MRAALSSTMMATDLADYLVRQGRDVPRGARRRRHASCARARRPVASCRRFPSRRSPRRIRVRRGRAGRAESRAFGAAARGGGRNGPGGGACADRRRAGRARSAADSALDQRRRVGRLRRHRWRVAVARARRSAGSCANCYARHGRVPPGRHLDRVAPESPDEHRDPAVRGSADGVRCSNRLRESHARSRAWQAASEPSVAAVHLGRDASLD